MKILFICPEVSCKYFEHVEAIAKKGWKGARFFKRDIQRHKRHVKKVFYGLGILTIGSMLPHDIEWSFIDENFEKNKSYEHVSCDLVALTGQVIQRGRISELIRYFVSKGTYVVAGGVHATDFADDYIQKGVSVIQGEGEKIFKAFLHDFSNGKPKPFYRQNPNDCIDLNTSPVPDFSVISRCKYSLVGVQTTRGCPYRCRYCNVSNILGEKYRHKSVEQVKEEVLQIKRIWPESMLYFYDDNLFGDKDYSFKLFEALKDTKLGRWGVHADISVSQDPKLLDLICSNGTPYLAIGFETLSKKNAQTLGNKMKTDFLSKYDESVCILKKRGIEVAGSFMFGFPGDSQSKLEQVLAFIKKHKIKGYITRYSVIPGSQLYDEVLTDYQAAKGRLTGTSTTKARTLNQFFMAKNGFRFEETEDIIINALKPLYKTKLPLPQIDALAVFRSFFY